MTSGLPAFGSSATGGKKGTKKASRLDDDWGGLLSDSSTNKGKSSKPGQLASGTSSNKANKRLLSDVNDDEFFRNLSTIGGKSGIPGSDSDSDDFSLDDDTPPPQRKTTVAAAKKAAGMDNLEDDLFGPSTPVKPPAGQAKPPPEKSTHLAATGGKKLPTKSSKPPAGDDLFGSDNDSSFGLSDSDVDLSKAKPGKSQADRISIPAKPALDQKPSAAKAVSSPALKPKKAVKRDDLFGDDSDLDVDSGTEKAKSSTKSKPSGAPGKTSGSRDDLDSLFGTAKPSKDSEDESGTARGARFRLDNFTSRLNSSKKSQDSSDQGVPAESTKDDAAYLPSGSGSGGNYMPTGSDGGGYMPSGPGDGGYFPSGSGSQGLSRSRNTPEATSNQTRPSTAPGRRKKVEANDGNGADLRPSSVPPRDSNSSARDKPSAMDDDMFGLLEGARRGSQQQVFTSENTTEYRPSSASVDASLPRRGSSGRPPSALAGSDLFSDLPTAPATQQASANLSMSRRGLASTTKAKENILPPSGSQPASQQSGQTSNSDPLTVEDAASSVSEKAKSIFDGKPQLRRKEPGLDTQAQTTSAADVALKEQLDSLQGENARFKEEVEMLKGSVTLLKNGMSRVESEKAKVSEELASKAAEVQSLLKIKADREEGSAVHEQQLATAQADLLAAKSALATAEASKCALEQEVESLKEHQRQQQRQHTSEKEASSGRYQAMESEMARVLAERQLLQASLTDINARHSQEIEAARESFRKREAEEKELSQRLEARLREETSRQAEHYRGLLGTAQKELESVKEKLRNDLLDAQQSSRSDTDRLRQDHRQALAAKEQQHEEHIRQMKANHELELQRAMEVAGQAKSLQGLITQVESSTASLGKLQTEVHSKNDQSLVQREQLVKYKEEQLAELHQKLVSRESHFEQEHARWQETISRIELQHTEQQRMLDQARWKLQQDEVRIKAMQKAVEGDRLKHSESVHHQAREFSEAKEKVLSEHQQLVQQCLEERRALATERAELGSQRQEQELQRKAFHDQSEKVKSELAAAMAVAEKRRQEIMDEQSALKLKLSECDMQMSTLRHREKKVSAKERELKQSAKQLKHSSKELEHVKKAFLTSKHHGEDIAKAAQSKHAEYLQTISQMKEEAARLQHQQQLLHQERSHLKRKAQKLASRCPTCHHEVPASTEMRRSMAGAPGASLSGVEVIRTKRRAARQLPPQPESLPQWEPLSSATTTQVSQGGFNLVERHHEHSETGTQSVEDSLHASHLHGQVYAARLEQAAPSKPSISHQEAVLDGQGLERLKERLKVHQTMAQIENRRKHWQHAMEKDQSALDEEDIYLTSIGLTGNTS